MINRVAGRIQVNTPVALGRFLHITLPFNVSTHHRRNRDRVTPSYGADVAESKSK